MQKVNFGNVRETFFANHLCYKHSVNIALKSDFIIDDKLTFEIGDAKKGTGQIEGINNAFIAADGLEYGFKIKFHCGCLDSYISFILK